MSGWRGRAGSIPGSHFNGQRKVIRVRPQAPPPSGLEHVFLANCRPLLALLRARSAGNDTEDLWQELWLRIVAAPAGPVEQPLTYLCHATNNLMLDGYRSARQSTRRDHE